MSLFVSFEGMAIERLYYWCRDCNRQSDGIFLPRHGRYAWNEVIYVCAEHARVRDALRELGALVNG